MEAIERAMNQHIGQDWGAAGYEYPHPSMSVRSLVFGTNTGTTRGVGRLDSDGIRLLGSGGGQLLAWVNAMDDPIRTVPYVELQASTSDPNNGAYLSLNVEPTGVNFGQINGTISNTGISFGMTVLHSDVAILPDGGFSAILTADGTNVGFRVSTAPLWLLAHVGDFGQLANGMIWYNSSTNMFRARVNGVTYDLITSGSTVFIPYTLYDAKGDLIVGTGPDTAARLAVGADDTILMADAAQATGLKWVASAIPATVGTVAAIGVADTFSRGDHVHDHELAHLSHDTFWNTKGDMAIATANDAAGRLTAGANDSILMSDSAAATNAKWAPPAVPVAVGTANAEGTSDDFARGSHVHAHEVAHVAHDTIWDAAGDLVVGSGADTAAKLAITVPAANILEVLGVVNGETTASWKAVHDATAPVTQAFGDVAAAGTALTAAHRDHKHGMPATPALDPHGAAQHTDITRNVFCEAAKAGSDGAGSITTVGASPDLTAVVALADGSTTGAYWAFQVPADWASGVITLQPVWSPGSTDATPHTVRWSIVAKTVAAGTTVTAAGTTVTFTGASAARTVGVVVYDTATSTTLTPAAAGDLFRFTLRRIGADAADSYVGTVNLLGVIVSYVASQ